MFRLCRNIFRKEYKEKHPDVKQVSVVSALVLFRHPSACLVLFVRIVVAMSFLVNSVS